MKQIFFLSTRVQILVGIFTAATYAASLTALLVKGYVIDWITLHAKPLAWVVIGAAAFALLQILHVLVNILNDHFRRWKIIQIFGEKWGLCFPRRIFRSDRERSSAFYHNLYQNLPKHIELRLQMVQHIVMAAGVLLLYLGKVWHDRFWIGLFILPFISGLSWLATTLFKKSYEQNIEQVARQKSRLTSWLQAYFQAYRETAVNWPPLENTHRLEARYMEQGYQIQEGLKRHARTIFKREFFGSMLVDWPYILVIGTIFLFAAMDKLSLGNAIVWIGITDYLVTANIGLRRVADMRSQIRALTRVIQQDLGWIESTAMETKDPALSKNGEGPYRFPLMDGSTVELSTQAGFYVIQGKNGAGKTTLLDTLIGYNHQFKIWDPESIQQLRHFLAGRTRILERQPVLFPNVPNFYDQIFGTRSAPPAPGVSEALHGILHQLLPPALAEQWLQRFRQLEREWETRGNQSLSNGEQIILSFARALSHWAPPVRFVISDECDAVLDPAMRKLYLGSLHHLAKTCAVYYVSHARPASVVEKGASWMTEVYMVGHLRKKKECSITPLRLSVWTPGRGHVRYSGNIGKALADLFAVVQRGMVHADPSLQNTFQAMDFHLDSCRDNLQVGETRSAGLALCVALYNTVRMRQGQEGFHRVAAIGNVLLDGSVEPVDCELEKSACALSAPFVRFVITPRDLQHIRFLPTLLQKMDSSQHPQATRQVRAVG